MRERGKKEETPLDVGTEEGDAIVPECSVQEHHRVREEKVERKELKRCENVCVPSACPQLYLVDPALLPANTC